MEFLLKSELPLVAEEVCLFPIGKRTQVSLNKLNEITEDVLLLTSEIGIKYPELYKHLDETPIVFTKVSTNEVTVTELENYLETLSKQLCNHFNLHELNVNDWNLNF